MNNVSGAEGIAPVVVERPDCAEWNGAREDLERKTGRGMTGEEKMRFEKRMSGSRILRMNGVETGAKKQKQKQKENESITLTT
jgi:hypothetical protein